MMRGRNGLIAACLLGLVFGCDAKIEAPEDVRVDQVPADVMKIAKKELPGVSFEQAWKGRLKGETTYEIRGRTDDGKTRELKISESGKVIEVE